MTNINKNKYVSKTKHNTFTIRRPIHNYRDWGTYKKIEYAEEMINFLNENNWNRELFEEKYEEIKTKSYEFLKYENGKYIIYKEINGEYIQYGSYDTLRLALRERKKFKLNGFPEVKKDSGRIIGNETTGFYLIYNKKRLLRHESYDLLLAIKNYLQEHEWIIEEQFKVKNENITYFLEKKENGNLKIIEKHIKDKLVIRHPRGKYILNKITEKRIREVFRHTNKELIMNVKKVIEDNDLKIPQQINIDLKNYSYELFKDKNQLKVFYKNDDLIPVFKKNKELRIIFPKRIINKFNRKIIKYVYYVEKDEKILIQIKKPTTNYTKANTRKEGENTQLLISNHVKNVLNLKMGSYVKFIIKNDKIYLMKGKKSLKVPKKRKIIKKRVKTSTDKTSDNNLPINTYSSKIYSHKQKYIIFVPSTIYETFNLKTEPEFIWKFKETKKIKTVYLILNQKKYRKKTTLGKKIEIQKIQKTQIGTYIVIPEYIEEKFDIKENSKVYWKIYQDAPSNKYIELLFDKI